MTRYYFAERIWFQSAFLLLAAVPATLIAFQFDIRTVNDINVWIKPLKFYGSTALHLATLAVLVRFLSEKARDAIGMSIVAGVSAFAAIVEIAVIAMQSARGVGSHFNFSTQFDALIYIIMAPGAVLIVMPAIVLGIWFLRAPVTEGLTPGLKLGAGLGLTLGFALTLVIAGYMSSRSGGHWIGAPQTDAGGLPLFGWSREGGDLRVPHFFATHLMQALPIVGYGADKMLGNLAAKRIVWTAAVIGFVVTVGTFLQALTGNAFIG